MLLRWIRLARVARFLYERSFVIISRSFYCSRWNSVKRNRCVTFFSERDSKSIFLFPRHKTWRVTRYFSVWAKKNEPEQNLPKKYAQLTRCKIFCHHRRSRSYAKNKETRNNKICTQLSFDRIFWSSSNKGLNRACLIFLCFLQGFNDLIWYPCGLVLPNGCRKFSENTANRVEKHEHFVLHKLLANFLPNL